MQVRAPIKLALLFCVALMAVTGWSTSAFGARPMRLLTTAQTKRLLQELPYRYAFRQVALPKGASGAVAGRVVGAHHTVLHFGIALGSDPWPVPVPRAGISDWTQGPGFVYTDDLQVQGKREKWERGPQFHTVGQEREAVHMNVSIREKLCKATTGETCGI